MRASAALGTGPATLGCMVGGPSYCVALVVSRVRRRETCKAEAKLVHPRARRTGKRYCKDTPVTFDMPTLETPGDAIRAMAAIMSAVADGDLTPGEANELAKLVDTFTRAIEAHELQERLRRLEAVTK